MTNRPIEFSSDPSSDPSSDSPHTGRAQPGMTPSVVHTFAIIDALAKAQRRLRLSEIVSMTALPKTTVYRLLNTMTALKVTERSNEGFVLGPALTRYANKGAPDHSDMIGTFYALAGRMQDEIGETIQLAVLTPPDVTFVAYVDSAHSVRLATGVGRKLPAHAAAAGKALLAFSPSAIISESLSAPLTALTSSTITDRRMFLDQLRTTRRRGWAMESQESVRSLTCVAAPVLRPSGTAIAAITVCLPVPEISDQQQNEIATTVVSYARELSSRISHQ